MMQLVRQEGPNEFLVVVQNGDQEELHTIDTTKLIEEWNRVETILREVAKRLKCGPNEIEDKLLQLVGTTQKELEREIAELEATLNAAEQKLTEPPMELS